LVGLGEAYIALNQLAQAEEKLKRALELNPEHVEALYHLGRLYLKRNQYVEAIDVLKRAAERDPEQARIHYELFLVYTRTGEKERAAKELDLFQQLEKQERQGHSSQPVVPEQKP
jgi:tetratricopeptide (TPR) repeat protein